jgi:hypothetical protein
MTSAVRAMIGTRPSPQAVSSSSLPADAPLSTVVDDADSALVGAAAQLIQPDVDGGFVACTRGGVPVLGWVLTISDILVSPLDTRTLIEFHANGCFIACTRETGEKQRETLQIRNG